MISLYADREKERGISAPTQPLPTHFPTPATEKIIMKKKKREREKKWGAGRVDGGGSNVVFISLPWEHGDQHSHQC